MKIESVGHWISENYPNAEKIVEVGIGNLDLIVKNLKKNLPNCKLIATDINEITTPNGIDFFVDDIIEPKKEIYQNSDLIYSIRSPPELHTYLVKLAKEMKSDLLIKPISSEEAPKSGRLINYKGLRFHIHEF